MELSQILASVDNMISQLESRPQLHLNIDDVKKVRKSIDAIDWTVLDIDNHAKFNSIAKLAPHLANISEALDTLSNLKDAITEYNKIIHNGMRYMKEAIDIVEANKDYDNAKEIFVTLEQHFQETTKIVSDFNKFRQLQNRFPLAGKLEAFKNTYVKEFYYPALQNTIGNKVQWNLLEKLDSNPEIKSS